MRIEEREFLFPNGERAIIRSAEPEDGPMNLERITGMGHTVMK